MLFSENINLPMSSEITNVTDRQTED